MSNRVIHLILGPLIYILCYYAVPLDVFGSYEANGAVGCILWMALWWIFVPVDLAVTAFIPIGVNALFCLMDMKDLIANYSSETILLLLGASIITASWEITGLDRRVAARLLSFVGGNLRTQIIVWFLLSAVLSSVLPNAVVCAAIIPIAVAQLKFSGFKDISSSRQASLVLLSIVYGAGVGGLATPLGGAMNLVTVKYIEQITGSEYMYAQWLKNLLPVFSVILVSNIIYMVLQCKKTDSLGNTKEYFKEEFKKLDAMSVQEKWALLLFIVAAGLSFLRPFYQGYLPGLKPAYVFIITAIIAFVISTKGGHRLLTWKSTQQKIVWELIFVFSGGIAVGTLFNSTGAALAIGQHFSCMPVQSDYLLVLMILVFTIILSDVTSNTATAAISIPLVIALAEGLNKDPLVYIYVASIGVNLSYMLPTSIRAIPVGYGLKPKFMFNTGFLITLMTIILSSFVGYYMVS